MLISGNGRRSVAEKTLRFSTLVFLFGYAPGIVLALLKNLSKTLPQDAFGWIAIGMLASWPVLHFLGYFRGKKVCAAGAAFVHCIFAGLIFASGWKAHAGHFSLIYGLLSLVYGGWHLSMGLLLVRLRVTEKVMATYAYLTVLILWLSYVMSQ